MAVFGKIDGPQDPDEDVIVIHLGHLSESQYDAVVKSVIEFMNKRWPRWATIGVDN